MRVFEPSGDRIGEVEHVLAGMPEDVFHTSAARVVDDDHLERSLRRAWEWLVRPR